VGWKAKGLTFQRSVEKWLKRNLGDEYDINCARWIEFVDFAGFGFAQPDFYFLTSDAVVLLEAKLTQCDEGYSQMVQLYRPLLRFIYRLPVVCVLVCKNLVKDPGEQRIFSPMEILSMKDELVFTWHYVT
jgi:hypothetical protein